MRITDVWTQPSGEILACSLGEDITPDTICKKIRVGDTEIEVKKTGVSASLCGKMIMIMELNVNRPEDVPLGVFKILQ